MLKQKQASFLCFMTSTSRFSFKSSTCSYLGQWFKLLISFHCYEVKVTIIIIWDRIKKRYSKHGKVWQSMSSYECIFVANETELFAHELKNQTVALNIFCCQVTNLDSYHQEKWRIAKEQLWQFICDRLSWYQASRGRYSNTQPFHLEA